MAERDRLILRGFAYGLSYGTLGRSYGISRERVRQIVSKSVRECGIRLGGYNAEDRTPEKLREAIMEKL
jgi:hypothetical protein